ncbi:MAG TPA: NAD+ synthase [Micromonosporaceae bacterium]|jgi:NAD+ synthase (glutamine-hydrolysing)
MPTLRLALAQVDPTVGDLPGNTALVRGFTRKAAESGAHLVVFPEMMVTGYPVEDLVFRETLVAASRSAVEMLAHDLAEDGLGNLAVVVGYLDADGPARVSSEAAPDRGPRNAAAVIAGGRVHARYFKHHLPNYGVFDEDRYFVPGDTLTVVRLGTGPEEGTGTEECADVAVTICEDLWQAGGPFIAAGAAGVGLVVNINGSPYHQNKDAIRLPLIRRRAAQAKATVAYVNMVGGQDELVFDGDSMVVAADGTLLARTAQFSEELLLIDLDLPSADDHPTPDHAAGMRIDRVRVPVSLAPPSGTRIEGVVAEPASDEAEVWQALVTGLRDYVRKNGFRSVLLGLSGGIDSSLVAAIAVDALGPDQVYGVAMPSEHSSEHSREDAAELAERTGMHFRMQPIQPMVDGFLANLALSGLAVENLQARVRGVILMALSNQDNHLVLTTGNKSELSVGYSTLYGDSVGGFNPIKDVPKTMVWRLATWRNAEAARRGETPPIPERSISKPPSAELRPGQLDTDSLPPYEALDALLADYIDADMGREELLAVGHDPDLVAHVARMVDLAEYKRRQSAPGTKISIKAFGRDRRLPITNRFQG